MRIRKLGRAAVSAVVVWACMSGVVGRKACEPPLRMSDTHRRCVRSLIDGGIAFLLSRVEKDGGWSLGQGAMKPAVTAMVLKVLVQHPEYDLSTPAVKKGFEALLGYQKKDGGFYEPRMGLPNYTTSVAVMALVAAGEPKFRPAIDKAVKFLRGEQIRPGSTTPAGEKVEKGQKFDGGVSYGKHGRPDLSNQGMWMEAMADAGIKSDDPDMQRALSFVLRLHNRKESNKAAFVAQGPNDGGFVYAWGESKAGAGPGGRGLRSYGSMTYVGFKSMLYAGLSRDDPRVKAAFQWIRRYWRLDSNPNMPGLQSKQGLFYYYHVFAKALRVWGEPVIAGLDGKRHNWRHELIDALGERVGKDGSWVNGSDRWNEGNPVLATCFAVLSLQETFRK